MNNPFRTFSLHENGKLKFETYYSNNLCHSTNGPAHIRYNEDGMAVIKEFWTHGKKHRIDGPAEIWYDGSDNIIKERYFLNDKEVFIHLTVEMMRDAENKTRTLLWILNRRNSDERSILVQILPYMFRSELDPKVFDNLTTFF